MKITRYIVTLLLLGAVLFVVDGCAPPADQLLAQGQKYYEMQDYHAAFEKILRAAIGGNYQAQYTIGYMYYYGIGIPRNTVQAVKWFRKAAYFGQPAAIHALHLIKQGAPQPLTLQPATTIRK